MMKKMKAAVIGYGGMGGWHAEHLLKSDVAELAGIYDIKEERSELARSRGIYAYDSLQALLDDKSVELVTVAIPNDSHEEVVVAALNAGKNVICADTVRPHRQQPTRVPRPWDSPGKNPGVGCHFLLQCMKVKSESEVAQSCPTLCDPMDCSLPGSFKLKHTKTGN